MCDQNHDREQDTCSLGYLGHRNSCQLGHIILSKPSTPYMIIKRPQSAAAHPLNSPHLQTPPPTTSDTARGLAFE